VARINAILKRRVPAAPKPEVQNDNLNLGKLQILPEQHSVLWDGQEINLTATEFAMLSLLAARPGHVFNRDTIMTRAYEHNVFVSDRTIDSHIRHIRRKFVDVGCPALIETVHGVGYKLSLTCP
jgi:two-component system, OmpR family, response regulator